jgi:hypothetical protein
MQSLLNASREQSLFNERLQFRLQQNCKSIKEVFKVILKMMLKENALSLCENKVASLEKGLSDKERQNRPRKFQQVFERVASNA